MAETALSGNEQRISVEVSDRRLPVRMVAGRLRSEVRDPARMVQSRIRWLGRPAVVVMAALLLPIIGVSRFRHLATA